ncbi:hypothetical protein F4780DRAFT_250033 [Xylariomycetidae sp. FL0641]|nr:hypothetical protein F4780DRAFT_250033 [Xylariomycetidae sp. FL0641]
MRPSNIKMTLGASRNLGLRVFTKASFPRRPYSSRSPATPESSASSQNSSAQQNNGTAEETKTEKTKSQSMADKDKELQRKMSGLSGDGGEAGVEYENGEPVAMKRSVKNNMFRYI